ncbi:MAG: hypothetical protein KME42_14025 [Tildeniella nuda ZEHNDER 1965/U140]|jgi:hypothetical protein|nr:hypothetical protein [Tildeniella nuda ZEHNDER 1965/U140]
MHLLYEDLSEITRFGFNLTQRLLYSHAETYQDWLIVPTVTPDGRFAFVVFDPDGDRHEDMYGETYCSAEAALVMAQHWVNVHLADLEEMVRESD